MARVTILQTNFTAGEISPRLLGRVDIARYHNGVEVMENAYPLIHGGALKRPGTLFVAAAKYPDKPARLIDFVFNADQTYILEFGDQYMRVFKDGAQVLDGSGDPYEIATPYTADMLADLTYTQGADTIFIAHEAVPLQRLRRFADDSWSLEAAPFVVEPFSEIGHQPAADLTLSAASVGAGRTCTASASAFLPADVGREITVPGGVAIITGYTSATVVTCEITSAFPGTSIAAGDWTLTGSPMAACRPSAIEPVGEEITLTLDPSTSLETIKPISGLSWSGGVVTVNLPGHGYSSGNTILIQSVLDGGAVPMAYNGTYTITVVDADNFTYPKAGDPGVAAFLGTARRSVSSATQGWRSEDVGKLVRINGGLCRITGYTSASVVNARILNRLTAAVAAPAGAWSLEAAVWSASRGYPRAVWLHDQRLICASSPAEPQMVWYSRIGEYLDFTLGVEDADAFAYKLSTDQINPVQHLAQLEQLVALTYGGEHFLGGGIEKPITPTNPQSKAKSVLGCSRVRPVRIGNELVFLQRGSRKLRAMSSPESATGYNAVDLSILADHITGPGIVAMAYQREIDPVLWLVRSDGAMASLTIDRDQDVIGWARHLTDGAIEWVSVIPNGDREEAWLLVRRTVDGQTVRYIERMDPGVYTDCSIVGTEPTGAAVWAGLDHLEGKSVAVVADGTYQGEFVVSGGQITLPRVAYAVRIGLPYTVRIRTLTPEVQTATGSAQGGSMRISEAAIRFLETIGAQVNGDELAFRNMGTGVLDAPPAPFTGVKRLEKLGWERGEAKVEITQTRPFPLHVLSIIFKFTVNS